MSVSENFPADSRPLRPEEVRALLPHKSATVHRSQRWPSLFVDLHQHHPPCELTVRGLDHHFLFVQLSRSAHLVQEREGRTHEGLSLPGDLSLAPAGRPMTWCSKGCLDVLHLHIAPEFLIEVACLADVPQPERVELVNCFRFRDPLVQQLAQALVRELETGGLGGELFADSLTRTLGVHLLRHHSTAMLAAPPPGGLPAHKLRRVIEYIHEHLAQELSR